MIYILFIVAFAENWKQTLSVSEFTSKKACEVALAEARKYRIYSDSRCIEVKK